METETQGDYNGKLDGEKELRMFFKTELYDSIKLLQQQYFDTKSVSKIFVWRHPVDINYRPNLFPN